MPIVSVALASAANSDAKEKRWATEMARGHTGGAFGMNLFSNVGLYSNETEAEINAWHSARDPGEIAYVLNPNLWCAELLPQLTGVVIHKDDCGTGEGPVGQAWRARYGGVAITKRHILYCAHAYSHAAGTWGPNLSITDPTRLRFIDSNGNTVDRVQIHQASGASSIFTIHNGVGMVANSHAGNAYGAEGYDLCVAVLDEDLPETVHIMKQISPENALKKYEVVVLSQEWQPQAGLEPTEALSDYPLHNRQMFYIPSQQWGFRGDPSTHPDFRYNPWQGDSGTPAMVYINGELLLFGLLSGGVSSQFTNPEKTWEQKLNSLIGVADSFAIAMGRMATPTGYTVTMQNGSLPENTLTFDSEELTFGGEILTFT